MPGPGAPADLIVPREDFLLGQVVTARRVERTVRDSLFGLTQPGSGLAFEGGDRVGFGELRFTAVPEPASAAPLARGLALAGWWRRAVPASAQPQRRRACHRRRGQRGSRVS